jgi:hypothetical protein
MAESTSKPNRWMRACNTAVVLELLRGGDAAELARQHGLSQAQLFSCWSACSYASPSSRSGYAS